MNILLRIIIMVLMLGPLAAPASFAVPVPEAAVVMVEDVVMEDAHACCPDDEASTATVSMNHMTQCDDSCNDCQHHCASTPMAVLRKHEIPLRAPTPRLQALPNRSPEHFRQPLLRPPHHA